MQDRFTSIEQEIPRVESSIAETETALGSFVSVEETQRLSRDLEDLRAKHELLTGEWEELMVQLEEQTTTG